VLELNYFSFSNPNLNPNLTHLPKHQTQSPNHHFSQRIWYVQCYYVHPHMAWSQKFRLTAELWVCEIASNPDVSNIWRVKHQKAFWKVSEKTWCKSPTLRAPLQDSLTPQKSLLSKTFNWNNLCPAGKYGGSTCWTAVNGQRVWTYNRACAKHWCWDLRMHGQVQPLWATDASHHRKRGKRHCLLLQICLRILEWTPTLFCFKFFFGGWSTNEVNFGLSGFK